MVDFNITRNVKNIEDIELSLPAEFSELAHTSILVEQVMRIRQSFGMGIGAPAFIMNTSADFDLSMEMEASPVLTYAGPYTASISATAGDCYIIVASRDSSASFNATDTKLGLGIRSVTVITPLVDYEYFNYKSWIPFVITGSPAINSGTTILSAILEVYAVRTNTAVGDSRQKVYCERAANAVTPTTYDELNMKRGTQNETTDASQPIWTLGTKYTYDVTTCVQEVINLSSWADGNTLAIMTRGSTNTSVNLKEFASFENTTYTEPKLVIVYDV